MRLVLLFVFLGLIASETRASDLTERAKRFGYVRSDEYQGLPKHSLIEGLQLTSDKKSVNVRVYKFDNKQGWIPSKLALLPMSMWMNPQKVMQAQIQIVNNRLVETGPGILRPICSEIPTSSSTTCEPSTKGTVTTLTKESQQAISAASLSQPAINQVRTASASLGTHPNSAIRNRVQQELTDDFEWVKNLNLAKRYGLRSLLDAAEKGRNISEFREAQRAAKNELLERAFRDPRFQGATGHARVSRLLKSLTLLGEFRTPSHQNPAHLFWTLRLMENRARQGYFTDAVKLDFEGLPSDKPSSQTGLPSKKGKTAVSAQARKIQNTVTKKISNAPAPRSSEIATWIDKRNAEMSRRASWTLNTSVAAALHRSQFSVWNKEDKGNLYAILSLEEIEAAQRIIKFVAEDEAGYWVATRKDPGIMTYYEPSIPEPKWFVPLAIPSIRNLAPEQGTPAEHSVDPRHFRGGTYR